MGGDGRGWEEEPSWEGAAREKFLTRRMGRWVEASHCAEAEHRVFDWEALSHRPGSLFFPSHPASISKYKGDYRGWVVGESVLLVRSRVECLLQALWRESDGQEDSRFHSEYCKRACVSANLPLPDARNLQTRRIPAPCILCERPAVASGEF